MKKLMPLATLVALVSIVAWGCGGGPERPRAPMDLTSSSSDNDQDDGDQAHDHDEGDHDHEHDEGDDDK